jgi:hypothetical protein
MSAAALLVAYGFRGALAEYLPGGINDDNFPAAGLYVLFMINDNAPWFGCGSATASRPSSSRTSRGSPVQAKPQPSDETRSGHAPAHSSPARDLLAGNPKHRLRDQQVIATKRGNPEGTPARARASTRGHTPSADSARLRDFRGRGYPRLPLLSRPEPRW